MVQAMRRLSRSAGRVLALLLTIAVIGAGLMVLTRPRAEADEAALPSPPPLLQREENVVTSDPIPTVQIDNGYVWSQATIGTTVYAVGDFDNARAPMANPGTQLTARSNVLAYDIETGALLPFAPQVNGVVKAVAASPDGSRIYIGGSFTSVNGQARWNMAALDAATGELISSFKPAIGGTGVYALVADGSMVYAGGLFTQGNGTPRKNLAAFNAANGALMPWAPETDLQVDAMVADPGGDKIVVGGRFSRVNGNTRMRGAAAVDRSTGAVDTDWELVQTVKNGATNGKAGIFSLAADDSAVYGTGWVYAGVTIGNLEGTFAAEADSGDVRWIADCLGDHYGVYSTGETVYTTSHTHACSTMGLHPEQSPREHRYAEAYTADVRGTLGRNPHAGGTYQNWEGTPAPSAYAWYPDFYVGTTTGMGQAGLSITGVGDTISIAGEFQGVNQGRFEGIVRFSTDPPNGAKDGPRLSSSNWQPSASSAAPGRTRISIPANWDRDDLTLTYELRRAGSSDPVATLTKDSTWWNQPTVILEDTTAVPGTSPAYTVVARDGDGNSRTSAPVTVTVAAGTAAAYTDAVLDDDPILYYPLGSTLQDWAGTTPATAGSGVSAGTPGIPNSDTGHSELSGSSSGRISSSARVDVGTEFSTELWFRTTTGQGGKLLGYGDSASGTSGSYDRHLYMQNNGRLVFGVYPGEVRTVQSPERYDDGQWHHAVATLSAAGQQLYVDGELVASDPSTSSAQAYRGYWRIGGDSLSGWPDRPSSDFFRGSVDEVAVYDRALTSAQISAHYAVGAGIEPPEADFEVSTDGAEVAVDAIGSSAAGDATIVEYRWDFGDGTPTVTGATASHTYEATGTFTVTLTVRDSNGLLDSFSREVSVLGPNTPPTAAFSADAVGLSVTADGTASHDPDGTVASYAWDWGDGTTSTGAVSSHAYASAGDYTITLTVTDDRDAEAEASQVLTVTHDDPVARFSTTASGLSITADAGESTASDGASLEYTWDWGDSSTSSGAVGTHAYAEDGVYEITLNVTDSLGATAQTSQSVTVAAEALAASDTFSRTVSSGWGAADEGGTWTPVGGSASAGSVEDGVGRLTFAPGNGQSMVLPATSVAQSSTEMTYTLEGAPSTGAVYVGTEARYVSGSSYRTLVWHRADGTSWLLIQRNGAIIASQPGAPGSWEAGSSFHLRAEVVGEAEPSIRMKVWPAGSAEPSGWQLETTDTAAEALTDAGASAVYAYRAGSGSGAAPVTVDDYRLRDLSGPQPQPPNEAPVASFTSSISGRMVTVDGSTSTDADGSIVTYAWTFGDGETASGVTANHEYAAAGSYTVTLTVTDDDGESHTATSTVVATDEVHAASDTFERTTTAGWGTADVGGAWSVRGGAASMAETTDGDGVLTLRPADGLSMVLPATDLGDSSTAVSYTLTGAPSTGAAYVGIESRFDGSSTYRSTVWHRADGTVWLLVQRNGAVIASQPLTGRTWGAGDTFRLRTEVTGDSTTTVRLKLWSGGAVEPPSWQLEVTDDESSAETASGSAGLYAYRAGSGTGQTSVRFDDLAVKAAGSDDVNMLRSSQNEEPVGNAPDREGSVSAPTGGPDGDEDEPVEETADPEGADVETDAVAPESSGAVAPDDGSAEAADDEEAAAPEDEADGALESDADVEPDADADADADAEGKADSDSDTVAEPEADAEADSEAEREEDDASEEGHAADDSASGDDFERDDAPTWGGNARGDQWLIEGVPSSAATIEDGAGRIALEPGDEGTALLEGTDIADGIFEAEFRVEEGAEPAGSDVGIAARASKQGGYHVVAHADVDGAITLRLLAEGEVLASQMVEGLHLEAGVAYTMRLSVSGTERTGVNAMLWKSGEEEPDEWQLTATVDAEQLSSSGRTGLVIGRSDEAQAPSAVSVERFEAVASA